MATPSTLTLALSFYYDSHVKKFVESPRSIRSRIQFSTEFAAEQIEEVIPVTYHDIEGPGGMPLRVCDRVMFWSKDRRFKANLPTSWLTVLLEPPADGAEKTEGKEV